MAVLPRKARAATEGRPYKSTQAIQSFQAGTLTLKLTSSRMNTGSILRNSARYDEQTFFDAFSSKDLITWTKHPRIFSNTDAPWIKRALWAPSIVKKGSWYYLFFGANDIQNDQQVGGIGIARASHPGGPFNDYLGKPLIDKFHNGAQPIDQFVFKDRDGSYYIIYGGWRHCNIAKLNNDFTGLVPFSDGTTFKEMTPKGYVEGAFMFVKDGRYYFMWSEGGWTGPDYAVAYAMSSSVFGPFERVGKILSTGSVGGHRRRSSFGFTSKRLIALVHRLSQEAFGRNRS
jgi:beta-xylosidase